MGRTTRERLIAQYHTLTRRHTIQEPRVREVLFKSFSRSLGNLLPSNKSAKILDVGCGEGSFLIFLKHQGFMNLSGFDLSSQNVSICQSIGLDFVTQFDSINLHEYNESDFDAIFVLDLIEHLPKEKAGEFIEQLYHLLKPGGQVIIQTPNMGSVVGLYTRYNDLSHEFGLTENTAKSLLALGGFSFDKIEITPCWNATTLKGYLREMYLRLLHSLFSLAEGEARPRIPTKNLLIKANK